MPVAFIVSVVLHLMVFLGVFIVREIHDDVQQPPQQEPMRMRIKQDSPIAASVSGTKDCKDFYFGIGYVAGEIRENMCEVGYLVKNGPAAKAGITAGDFIVSEPDEACPGKGPEGTIATITYHKTPNELGRTVTITRAKICNDK